MMNGEGTSDTLPEAVSLNDKLDGGLLTCKVPDQKLLDTCNEVSPVSSQYSSCGESDFDRYCSANSVMGTPSLCGSVGTFQDFTDSDFGSMKSSRISDVGSLENFSLGGRFGRKFEDKSSLSLGRLGAYSQRSESSDVTRGLNGINNEKSEQVLAAKENESHAYDDMENYLTGGVILWEENINSEGMQSPSTSKSLVKSLSAKPMVDHLVNVRVEGGSTSHLGIDQEHLEGETSSQLEHSESDCSMYGYGTDNEEQTGLRPRGYTHYPQDMKSNGENTLCMTSSVAYGSDDLNEFMQETMGNPKDLFVTDETQGHNQNEIESVVRTSKSSFVPTNIDLSQKQEDMEEGSASHINIDQERSEGEISSRLEHSESEGSMYGYGTDNEEPMGLPPRGYAHYSQDMKANSENTLLMTSSVAYGSDDLNDFMQETMRNPHDLFVTDETQKHNQNEYKSEVRASKSTFVGTIIDLSQKQEDMKEGSASHIGIDQECSEGETSPRLEHSESEGSTYGYGTDNEEAMGLPPRGYTDYSQDVKANSKNTLFMTSSVAYGSDDLNDFMQETMINPQDLFVMDGTHGRNQNEVGSEVQTSESTFVGTAIDFSQKQKGMKDFHMNEQTQVDLLRHDEEQVQLFKDMAVIGKQAEDVNQLKMEVVSQVEEAPLMDVLSGKPEHANSNKTAENHIGHLTLGHVASTLTQDSEDHVAKVLNDHKPYLLQSLPNVGVKKQQNVTLVSSNIPEDVQMERKAENYELNEFYDEVVFEMEEILLDSGESPAARFTHGRKHHSQVSIPSRDGGSTASTSSMDNSHSMAHNHYKIDGIEVVGAKQMKGDVSLAERLVGVKEYTVYRLRVWSGTHQWEVERRYRDFFTLYRRLKTSFADKGWDLPSPWLLVGRESRKYFGNASPDVVSERSILIQECLQSILDSKFSSGLPNSMIWFLSPSKSGLTYPGFNTQNSSEGKPAPGYMLGQSISLIVEIRPHKPMRQVLEAQHYTCAGCHKYFDEGKTRLWEFVQTLGWGKPRLCEYSGQVFCSSCHINETAILPARVLHWWDFTEYPVSQLAKSYLDSIHDKPMLCVSAVNPFLFSKVPPLQHVINVRKRIGRMLPYVRCPFRRSIYKGVGSRRYLLESTDFFALKDLVDLSKGVFAALPVMVETISKKIVDHITDECLICYDVGVPCGARQACDDPSSLIFPFQEGEIERCKSCELVYHKACFKKMATCPCGVDLETRSLRNLSVGTDEVHVAPNNLERDLESKSSMRFLSGLLSKASPVNFWGRKDNDTVIPMGSLPSSSL